LLQDGDIGVGIFPKGEEVFVSGKRPNTGSIGIRALQSFRGRSLGPRPNAPALPPSNSTRCRCGRGFSETRLSRFALPPCQIHFTANVGWIKTGKVGNEPDLCHLDRNGSL